MRFSLPIYSLYNTYIIIYSKEVQSRLQWTKRGKLHISPRFVIIEIFRPPRRFDHHHR